MLTVRSALLQIQGDRITASRELKGKTRFLKYHAALCRRPRHCHRGKANGNQVRSYVSPSCACDPSEILSCCGFHNARSYTGAQYQDLGGYVEAKVSCRLGSGTLCVAVSCCSSNLEKQGGEREDEKEARGTGSYLLLNPLALGLARFAWKNGGASRKQTSGVEWRLSKETCRPSGPSAPMGSLSMTSDLLVEQPPTGKHSPRRRSFQKNPPPPGQPQSATSYSESRSTTPPQTKPVALKLSTLLFMLCGTHTREFFACSGAWRQGKCSTTRAT